MTMELKELRKQIRRLGYNVKTESLSFGRVAVYQKDGKTMPSIFTPETLPIWQPLIDFLKGSKAMGYDGLEDRGERITSHRLND